MDSTSVYWTTHKGSTVMKAPLEGGFAQSLAFGQSYPHSIAVDSTSVYWSNLGTVGNGKVMKVPLEGGSPVTLAQGQSGVDNIAVDSTSVYWTTQSTVMKIAK